MNILNTNNTAPINTTDAVFEIGQAVADATFVAPSYDGLTGDFSEWCRVTEGSEWTLYGDSRNDNRLVCSALGWIRVEAEDFTALRLPPKSIMLKRAQEQGGLHY